MITYAQWQQRAAQAMAAAGHDEALREARYLIIAAIGLSHDALLLKPETRITPEQSDTLEQWLQRRIAHEPLAKIIGRKEFYGRAFRTSSATLDPRPDSETLIDAALSLQAQRILDVGTGTGCLLLTLLAEWPQATGVGVDVSESALEVARANAAALHVTKRVAWQRTSYTDGLTGTFDLIISNPPYIPTATVATLPPAVREYDPHLALDGGADGLVAYRALSQSLAKHLAPHGHILLEIGQGQAQAVAGLFTNAGLTCCASHSDVGGIVRVLHFVLAAAE